MAVLLYLCFPFGRSRRLPLVACRFLLPWSRFTENRIVLSNVSWQFGPSSFVLGHFFLFDVGLGLNMKRAGVTRFFGPTAIVFSVFIKNKLYPKQKFIKNFHCGCIEWVWIWLPHSKSNTDWYCQKKKNNLCIINEVAMKIWHSNTKICLESKHSKHMLKKKNWHTYEIYLCLINFYA